MGIRITTWNVNGIRNPFGYQPWRENRTFQAMFDTLEADIVIMQETKIQRKDLRDDMVLVPGWDVYFSLPKFKKGYSGVAIYTRNSKCAPIRAEEGITGILCPPNSSTRFRDLPEDQQIGGYPKPGQLSSSIDEATLDSEGRCVILEFPAFVLIGVYSPATRDETRTEFRLGFIDALDARVRNLVALGKEVVLTGDLNIIRSGFDSAGLQEQLRKDGMTMDEFVSMPARRFLNQIVFGGKVIGERDEGREKPVLWDLCREFHPDRPGMYTCWETRKNARPGNFGSRIDYVLCSSGLKDWVEDSNIQEGLLGSDHCPVFATLRNTVEVDGKKLHIIDKMNPEGMFKDGKRLRDWSTKDLLPMSAKLIPEFDRRRSIRDMFFKPNIKKQSSTQDTESRQQTGSISSTTTLTRATTTEEIIDDRSPAEQNTFSSTQRSSTTDRTPNASPAKRQAASPSSNRPQKKNKATLSKEDSRSSLGRSQSSLMGFFKSKSPAPASVSAEDAAGKSDSPASERATPAYPANSGTMIGAKPNNGFVENGLEDCKSGSSKNDPDSNWDKDDGKDKEVFDPIKSKESWSKLLGKRVPPRCEHDEPCISLLTKKPGINCGRSFYICPRPLGPSGEKEQGTPFRCRTFIWSSDWNGQQ